MEHLPFIPFGQSIPEVLKSLAEGLAEMHLRDPPPEVKGMCLTWRGVLLCITRLVKAEAIWSLAFIKSPQ